MRLVLLPVGQREDHVEGFADHGHCGNQVQAGGYVVDVEGVDGGVLVEEVGSGIAAAGSVR